MSPLTSQKYVHVQETIVVDNSTDKPPFFPRLLLGNSVTLGNKALWHTMEL